MHATSALVAHILAVLAMCQYLRGPCLSYQRASLLLFQVLASMSCPRACGHVRLSQPPFATNNSEFAVVPITACPLCLSMQVHFAALASISRLAPVG